MYICMYTCAHFNHSPIMQITNPLQIPGLYSHLSCYPYKQYAVKAQTSLAPLSRFRGSRVTTAHAHQCCRFQSYAKTVPS